MQSPITEHCSDILSQQVQVSGLMAPPYTAACDQSSNLRQAREIAYSVASNDLPPENRPPSYQPLNPYQIESPIVWRSGQACSGGPAAATAAQHVSFLPLPHLVYAPSLLAAPLPPDVLQPATATCPARTTVGSRATVGSSGRSVYEFNEPALVAAFWVEMEGTPSRSDTAQQRFNGEPGPPAYSLTPTPAEQPLLAVAATLCNPPPATGIVVGAPIGPRDPGMQLSHTTRPTIRLDWPVRYRLPGRAPIVAHRAHPVKPHPCFAIGKHQCLVSV